MRKFLLSISALALLLVCLTGLSFVGHAQSMSGLKEPGVGTYYGAFDVGGGLLLPFVANNHADGSTTTVDGTDFGLGGSTKSDSAGLGRWYRSGPQQGTTETMTIGYDPVSGFPTTVTRATAVINFNSPALLVGSGTNTTRLYDLTLGEDPSDPNGGTITGVYPFTVAKIY